MSSIGDMFKNVKRKADGWMNVLVGLGKKQDKTQYSYWGEFTFLCDDELSKLYTGEGFAKRIIDLPANDMIREWITIENDDDDFIGDILNDLKAKSKFNEALKWQRLYGGSIVIVGAMDGESMDKPLNINHTRSIEWLYVVDKSQIELSTSYLVDDTTKNNFGKIEVYDMYIGPMNKRLKVHSSRVLEFFGQPAPKRVSDLDNEIRYWGMSELQSIWEKLRSYGAGFQSVENILFEFIVGKYKLKGLAEKLATNQEEEIITRMEIVGMFKSSLNAILLDADHEDYIRDTANLGGLSDLLDRLMINLAGSTGIPVTKLFGRSPAGMNATGESDTTNYYDNIAAMQESQLHDPLQDLVDLIAKVYDRGDKHQIKFNPLFQMDEKEMAEIANKNALTDQIYMDSGVIGSDEVRYIRFPKLDENYNVGEQNNGK